MRARSWRKMIKILQKSYGWRAERYKQDAKGWKTSGQYDLYAYYSGRAEECKAIIKELETLADSTR